MKKIIMAIILTASVHGAGASGGTDFTVKTGAPVSIGVSDDLFQTTNIIITAHYPAHFTADIRDLFTGSELPIKLDDLVFNDSNEDESSRYYIDFRTKRPVDLTKITIGLGSDYKADAADQRSVRGIKIYAAVIPGEVMDHLIADIVLNPEYTDAYGNAAISVSMPISEGPLRYFRVEFTGSIPGVGPRILEIDGFGK